MYRIVNTGKKEILITHIGGSFENKQFMLHSNNIPKVLNPGESFIEWINLSNMNKKISSLFAIDALGRTHVMGKKERKELIKGQK